MKRFSITIAIALLVFLTACFKDTGNYTYNDINEITISGLADNYSATIGVDTLRLRPKITMTEANADPARFVYRWVLYLGTRAIDTIGTSPALEYKVNLSPNTYTIYLRVTDNQTGITAKAHTDVLVATRYSIGLMLMGTGENGNADVDMITTVSDTLIVHGILSNSGLPALHDPVTIVHNGNKDTSSNYGRVWVMTKSGSYYLDRKSMLGTTSRNFASIDVLSDPIDRQTLTPILYIPQITTRVGATGSAYARAVMTSDGNIFPTHTFITGGDFYTNPVNRVQNDFDKLLKTAPYLFYGINSLTGMMWYDTDNQRFMNYSTFGTGTYSVIPTDNAADSFPWNQASTGRTLVYGENTRNTDGGSTNGNSFAIMKDGGNKYYVYKFYCNGAAPAKRDFFRISTIATDFDKASVYAFSSRRSLIFYAVGSTLYCYDYNKGFEKIYQFPEITDEITMLKFDTQIDYATNSLYIGTYNSTTKGRLRRFTVGTDPNTVTITPVDRADWNGLVKIKDMNWRPFN